VSASNWVTALGLGLQHYEVVDGLERLACEVLPNGTVIARDIATGAGFIVREAEEAVAEAERPQASEGLVVAQEAEVEPETAHLRAQLVGIRDATSRGKACQAALVLARKVVTAESGAVILDDGDSMRFYAAAGPQAHRLIGARLPAGSGIAGFCIRHRRSLVLDDASEDPRHVGDIDRLTGYVTHALACVPIVHMDRCFGVIEMINLPDNTTFSRKCVNELHAIAQTLAGRLERHRAERAAVG
jgi:hypothetical protein